MLKEPLIQKARCHFGPENFDRICAWYMLHGYLYIGPDCVIFAQPHGYDELINNKKSLDKCNAWYIQYASGDIKRFFDLCPYDLEWAIFERRGKKRKAYNFKKLKKRLQDGRT